MPLIQPRTLDGRTMRLLRLGFVAWAVVWFVIAGVTAYELYVLRDLGSTLGRTGVAVSTTGKALEALAGIPIVGSEVGALAHQVQAAGASAVASGRADRSSTTDLAVLIGVAIALIPSLPVLGLYLPLQAAWRRERRAIARALRERGDDPLLEEYLARRAVSNLPYAELRAITTQPWRDLQGGRWHALADAELARLGLPPRRLPNVSTLSAAEGKRR